MKKFLILITLVSTYSAFCKNASSQVILDSIPCEFNKMATYEIKQREKVNFLPESLGGNKIQGFIGLNIFFNHKNNTFSFAIFGINLRDGSKTICKYFNSKVATHPLDRTMYNNVVKEYYDFVNHFLIYKVEFIRNENSINCTKKQSSTVQYYLRIGKKYDSD